MSCTGRRGIAPPWPQTTLTLASTSMRLKMMLSNGTSSGSRYSREQYSNGPRRLRRVGYREEFHFTGQQRLRAAVQIQWRGRESDGRAEVTGPSIAGCPEHASFTG